MRNICDLNVEIFLMPFFQVVEGSAGVAIGAFLQRPEMFSHKSIVIVACGSSISPATLGRIIAENQGDVKN